MAFADAFRGKRVLVTGHTGFKGAWLSTWLLDLGAVVTGVALAPPTEPALFDQLGLAERLDHRLIDIREPGALTRISGEVAPDFVFHLAAQPLVRLSYVEPVRTYSTNVIGTVNVLEALRHLGKACTAIAVTTDKVYLNTGSTAGYREDDKLGGADPYSSSKAAAEMVIEAYRKSYFSSPDSSVRLAAARAGNVVGGGDWALDRIIPDSIRALQRGTPIPVRNKAATRPWQHVLEPLSGYLWLAALSKPSVGRPLADRRHTASGGLTGQAPDLPGTGYRVPVTASAPAGAYNFGPTAGSNRTVEECVTALLKHWPGKWEDKGDPTAVHEAHFLSLNIEKAGKELGWKPVWDFDRTMAETASWYKSANAKPAAIPDITLAQIAAYQTDASKMGLAWTK